MIFRLMATFFLLVTHSVAQTPNVSTGSYEITKTPLAILGEELAPTYANLIDVNEEVIWEIHVPENYDPNNPPGVMVYISPQNIVNEPNGWLEVTERRNLIWIAARKSGNKEQVSNRISMAMLALPLLQSTYNINTNRIYVSGFSGGGRIASLVATNLPHVFKGALYNCGANFWDTANDEQLLHIKNNRFVFLTGSDDFNLDDTKRVYAKYKKAGVKNIKLMVIPRMGHSNPKRAKFSQALEYLDDLAS